MVLSPKPTVKNVAAIRHSMGKTIFMQGRHFDLKTILVNGIATASLAMLATGAFLVEGAIANPAPSEGSVETSAETVVAQDSAPEIDTSITREYEPAIIYLPDPMTQELVPQSVLVTSDAPAAMAVGQIVDAYEGQDVGITGYEVSVNSQQREAEINFEVTNERGGEAFQSLSSANQYSLFEAIRETLLTHPVYGVDEVIFQANDSEFNI